MPSKPAAPSGTGMTGSWLKDKGTADRQHPQHEDSHSDGNDLDHPTPKRRKRGKYVSMAWYCEFLPVTFFHKSVDTDPDSDQCQRRKIKVKRPCPSTTVCNY
ncbi:uncharacterized protein P174DRAFT_67730 [Aspergillus novofumigatus IBT 16806]|uniref:Uncharacterized protein n=1 Tax=Aspergillus novofumigatus (strain IBT 16806) TaxID=1392255 RepID=A0A2I1BU64_ASPN1|nr:uncharacterized protein P174DRAFT_67730 [Aspergillus novofumigatus IBT 16806]PKX88821.1 hypothetical protein P174DRAFT_67730 [Aspergillus novofumigatus IBT 16806]